MNRLPTAALAVFTIVFATAQTPDQGADTAPPPGAHLEKAQTENQFDANKTLFTVIAALNAAGYDTGADSPSAYPLRALIRQQLAAKDIRCLRDLKYYYQSHHHRDSAEDLSQYVSFALSVGPPPAFEFLYGTSGLPPDVRQFSELPELLTRFYDDANIEDLWKQSQPAFDKVIAYYHAPLARSILEANAYLRSETSGVLGHRFQVYVDLLAVPGEIQSRNYRTDTYVVMTPSMGATAEQTEELAAEQIADVRHAYLHSILDPLAVRYYTELDAKIDLQELAKPAPALDEMYKEDFSLLATESLIKAVEARLAPRTRRDAMVTEATHEGFILTAAFYEGLGNYENQDRAMRMYYPDLIKGINVKAERQRLAGIQFASARNRRGPDQARPSQPQLSKAEKLLADAEDLAGRRQLDLAKAEYLKVLEEPPQPTVHARAWFGLARLSVLQRDPENAEKLFKRSIEAGPDPETKSWAYYYLGRLEEAADLHDEALKYFQLTVNTSGGSQKAIEAAEKAIDKVGSGEQKEASPNNGSR